MKVLNIEALENISGGEETTFADGACASLGVIAGLSGGLTALGVISATGPAAPAVIGGYAIVTAAVCTWAWFD